MLAITFTLNLSRGTCDEDTFIFVSAKEMFEFHQLHHFKSKL